MFVSVKDIYITCGIIHFTVYYEVLIKTYLNPIQLNCLTSIYEFNRCFFWHIRIIS